VHRIIEYFEAFKITTIPRTNNTLVDSLATVSLRLSPLEDYGASWFTVELLYKPSVPKNISNWKAFEGYEKIINFLTNQENFKYMSIDGEVLQEKLVEIDPHELRSEIDHSTGKPRFCTILKGVSNLENLFDLRKIFKRVNKHKHRELLPHVRDYKPKNLRKP
jgi:hypothetical protein